VLVVALGGLPWMIFGYQPSPSYNIDEPTAKGTSNAPAESGDQVDIGAPLGNVADWE
jgi:hypothetical protein